MWFRSLCATVASATGGGGGIAAVPFTPPLLLLLLPLTGATVAFSCAFIAAKASVVVVAVLPSSLEDPLRFLDDDNKDSAFWVL